MKEYDLVIIGAGAAGLLCSIEASKKGISSILLIEKDPVVGGALSSANYKIDKAKNKTGLEYKETLLSELRKYDNIEFLLETMALKIEDDNVVICTNKNGIKSIKGKNIILANGAKEGSRKAVSMVGDRCSGIYTLGMSKKIFSMKNMVPGKDILIYGNETLYMLEQDLKKHNVNVVGIVTLNNSEENYGLTQNIYNGYDITSIIGDKRVESVVLNKNNEEINVKCDTIIFARPMLSDGLVAMRSNIKLSPTTTGPIVNKDFITSRDKIFACGNGIYIHDDIESIEEECKILVNCIK